jgi:hypothetical protein
MNDSDPVLQIGAPLSDIVTHGASLPPGRPRTSMFAPATPLELSAQTPGTSVKTSAVLLGETRSSAASLMVVMA